MEESTVKLLEMIGIWFTGIMTLLAVVVALLLQKFTEWLQRPKLEVVYDKDNKEDNRYLKLDDREERWIRVRVQNTSNYEAKDAEIRLMSIKRDSDSNWGNRANLGFKVSNRNAVTVRIPPKFTVHFDIAYVSNILNDDKDDVSFYLVTVHEDLKPWDEEKIRIESDPDNVLEIGKTLGLRLAVLYTNGPAIIYEMEVKIDDRDKDDPSSKHHLGKDHFKRRIHVNGPNKIDVNDLSPED